MIKPLPLAGPHYVFDRFNIGASFKLSQPLDQPKPIGQIASSLISALTRDRQVLSAKIEHDPPKFIVGRLCGGDQNSRREQFELDSNRYRMIGTEITLNMVQYPLIIRSESDQQRWGNSINNSGPHIFLVLERRLSPTSRQLCREIMAWKNPIIFDPYRGWNGENNRQTGNVDYRQLSKKQQRALNKMGRSAELKLHGVYCEYEDPVADNSDILSGSESIPVYNPRFGKSISLNYETLSKLEIGDCINPLSEKGLQPAFDPAHPRWPRDRDGNNAIAMMDYGPELSLPIIRPTEWGTQDLEHCKSLQVIPASDWEAFIDYLVGIPIQSVDTLVDTTTVVLENCSNGKKKKKPHDKRCHCEKKGQCFRGEENSPLNAEFVPPYIIFPISVGDKTFYVLDSPLYGVALRVYNSKEQAVLWARGGKWRAEANQTGPPLLHLAHDPEGDWQKKFASAREMLFQG